MNHLWRFYARRGPDDRPHWPTDALHRSLAKSPLLDFASHLAEELNSLRRSPSESGQQTIRPKGTESNALHVTFSFSRLRAFARKNGIQLMRRRKDAKKPGAEPSCFSSLRSKYHKIIRVQNNLVVTMSRSKILIIIATPFLMFSVIAGVHMLLVKWAGFKLLPSNFVGSLLASALFVFLVRTFLARK